MLIANRAVSSRLCDWATLSGDTKQFASLAFQHLKIECSAFLFEWVGVESKARISFTVEATSAHSNLVTSRPERSRSRGHLGAPLSVASSFMDVSFRTYHFQSKNGISRHIEKYKKKLAATVRRLKKSPKLQKRLLNSILGTYPDE